MRRAERIVLYAWIVCVALAISFVIRPSLFTPLEPEAFAKAQTRLKALWVGALSYQVDFAAFPSVAQGRQASMLADPLRHMAALYPDPYSMGNKAAAETLDISGEQVMGRVRMLYILVLLFGLALAFLGVLPVRPWTLEQIMLLWVMFCLPVLTLALLARAGPVMLGTVALLVFFAGPWVLFLTRRLSFEALLVFSLSVLLVLAALYREQRTLLWVSVGLIGLGGARVAAASGALGKQWLEGWRSRRVSWGLQVEVSALCLTLVAGLTAVLLADWILREKAMVSGIETAGEPFAVFSTPDFFVASSNGPNFMRDWDEQDVKALLEDEGEAAAEAYLAERQYDPSNGTASPGDYIIYARHPRERESDNDSAAATVRAVSAAEDSEGAEESI